MFGKLINSVGDFLGKAKAAASRIGKKVVNFIRQVPTIGNNVNAMDPVDRKYAVMCSEVYNPPSQRQNIEGYTHSNDTEQHSIYTNGTERVLAIRGTANMDDVATDIQIVTGNETSTQRFQEELNFARNNNITKVTGHSLGGTISAYISDQLRVPGVIFNAGAGSGQLIALLRPNSSLVRCYKILGDPVSLLWTTGDVRILQPKPDMNPHTIKQFL